MFFYQTEIFITSMIELMNKCNKIVLDIYNSNDFSVQEKEDKSPLTRADLECNTCICNFLKNYSDEILIISEENKNLDYEMRKKYEYCWLVDPIDGTKEFVNRNGEFTINIGLCHKGSPVFGTVSVPVKQQIYYGISGLGSYKLSVGKKEKISVSNKNIDKDALTIAVSRSHMSFTTRQYIEQFGPINLIIAGSSLKLLLVAEGTADMYPRLGPTSEWDTCAAHAVVKYAGGCVTKHEDSLKELTYNKKDLLNPYFIVC